MSSRTIVLGDLLALFAFALFGLASHEHEVSAAALARTFVPFAVSWLAIGTLSGAFEPSAERAPAINVRIVAAYAAAAIIALIARSIIFDRTLLNAFFVIALVGNALVLFGWRAAAAAWIKRRSSHTPQEATQA